MSPEYRNRVLEQLRPWPSAQKIIIMGWRERGAITGAEAERLIRGRGLENA